MPVTPANKDSLRERAFALSAQGIGYREIASQLGINKNTVQKYVLQERKRRSYDREAEEELRRAIASLRSLLDDLWERYNSMRGDGPMAGFARARLSESIRRVHRDLVALYGVVLPETDAERILDERGRRMEQAARELEGFPEVGEQAIVDRHIEELDKEIEETVSEYGFTGWRDVLQSHYDDESY
jgi:predicted transcriptional regulator